jgi:LmbE family N-acetylglucosaminyl deacetylase
MSTMRKRIARLLLNVADVLSRSRREDVTRGSALIIAPHPDDEVFGCGGTIAKKVRLGARIHVAIMTDGRTSHAAFIDPDELVKIRREEAAHAARALGMSADNYRFLNFPDGELAQYCDQAIAVVSSLLNEMQPREVFVPHARDVQPDHEATYNIVLAALQRHGARVSVYEYPVWLWHTWPWTWGTGPAPGQNKMRHACVAFFRMLQLSLTCSSRVDISDVRTAKLAAVNAYRSQIQRREGMPKWPIMADVAGGEFLERLTGNEERFRKRQYLA